MARPSPIGVGTSLTDSDSGFVTDDERSEHSLDGSTTLDGHFTAIKRQLSLRHGHYGKSLPSSDGIRGVRFSSLSKSNSTASRDSNNSHVSVHAIGTIPIGGLHIHRDSDADSEATEMETRDSTAEEADPAKCLIRGDVFRLLDLDGKFMIGHDNMTVSTNTKPICGFRDIPPGPHFLWVQQREAISRCGYWYITGDRGVVRVRQWDAYNEVLGDVASQFEVRMQKANIDTIYSELIPYSLGGGRNSTPNLKSTLQSQSPNFETDPAIMWHSLTAAISERFLNRVTNKKGVDAWLIDSSDCVKWDGNSNMPQPLATATVSQAYKLAVGSMLNFLFSQDFQTLRLLDIGGSNQAAVDTSTRILALLNSKTDAIGDDDIAAELQFTFLTGTHLGNAACLEQWWNLVLKIVLRSYKLCLWRPALCCSMLKTLHAQLVYTEDYVDISHQENGHARAPPTEGPSSERLLFQFKPQNRRKLHKALALYKHQLNEMLLGEGNQIKPEQVATGQAFENLEAWLYRRGWDLRSGDVGDGEVISADDSDDDDAPVIVELDEDGHEVGLVSFSRD